MASQSKAARIRTHLKTGQFSTREIAALVGTTPAAVRVVKQRLSKSDPSSRLHCLEQKVARLEAEIRSIKAKSDTLDFHVVCGAERKFAPDLSALLDGE